MIWDSLGPTDGLINESTDGIILGRSDDKVLGNIFGNVDGIFLALVVEIELGSLDGSFGCSNDDNIEV